MGAKLQPEIGAGDKLQSRIHLNTHTIVARLKVGRKEARRRVEVIGLQIIIQMTLVWKHQMMEEMLIGLVQMMRQIK